MGGFTEVASEVGVGYGDELLGPLPERLAQEPGDTVFSDDCVSEGAGYGDDPALGELRARFGIWSRQLPWTLAA